MSMHSTALGRPHEADNSAAILRASLTQLSARHADLVLAVHRQLLELLPGVVTRLSASGRTVAQRLVATLFDAGVVEGPVGHAAVLARRVGAQNQADGFGREHYATVSHVLLHAVRAVYPGEWSSSLSSAWVEYLLWLRGELMGGAAAEEAAGRERAAEASSRPRHPEAEAEPGGRVGDEDDEDDDEDDDDEDGPGYAQLMVSMTMDAKRDRKR